MLSRPAQPNSDPLEVLQRVFGYASFRGPQEGIVRHVIGGGSGLVLMPTGGGKSLCYQVPALCTPGLAVVISPLIALMQDQVEALQQLGVAAAALHSGLKSCPHCETQWASSMAKRASGMAPSRSSTSALKSRSGET